MTDTKPKRPRVATDDAQTEGTPPEQNLLQTEVTDAEIVAAQADPEPATVQPEPARDPWTAPKPDPVLPDPVPPTRDTSPPPAARQKSGSTFTGILIGAVLAIGAGYGAQQYLGAQAAFDPTPFEARLAAAEAEAQALRAELTRLAETAGSPPAADAGLADRIAALEAAQQPDLTARLDGIEADLAALANAPSGTGVAPAALTALQADVAALKSQTPAASSDLTTLATEVEARLTEAETRAADLTAEANAIAAAATRNAALGQIGAAIDSGLPYTAAIAALGAEDLPEVLTANAAAGLPSIATLRAGFPEAARLALEQALRANPGESWTDRVGTFLRNQTGARSLVPREGNDPDAILSRAEAALARADVPGALTELATLPPEAQTAMEGWTALAQQRLDAQAALASLLQGAEQ